MALFQPTNVTPSVFGGGDAGTVDVTKPLTVSWQVNGSSAMVAYQIQIMQNTTASTVVLNTGKVTLASPFYGTDSKGNVNFFSVEITAAQMSSAGMTNGYSKGYKLQITQWWGATDAASITQTSASYFITRALPTLTMGAIPSPMTTRVYTFTATYAQAQNDAIEWARWQIVPDSNPNNMLQDTGKIYGTSDLQTTYDGFITGYSYRVKCTIQTINGVEATTGWITFPVEYNSSDIDENINLCAMCGTDAVQITFPQNASIPPTTITGEYSYEMNGLGNECLYLETSSDTVEWNQSNLAPMSFETPYTIVLSGQFVNASDVDVLTAETNGHGSIMLGYYGGTGCVLSITKIVGTSSESSTTAIPVTIYGGEYFTVIMDRNGVYFRLLDYAALPLFPEETLYPGNSIYPSDGVYTANEISGSLQLWPTEPITSLKVAGPIRMNYLWIIKGSVQSELAEEISQSYNYLPVRTPDTYFLANFNGTLGAGSLNTDEQVDGYSIYRQEGNDSTYYYLMDAPINSEQVRDYSVVSQKTYRYYFYAKAADTYVGASIVSTPVTPFFWNYTLLCCSQDSSGVYHVQSEYRFALDVESGSVSNNNQPNVLQNFTRYPLIQPVTANYRSGTLTALIGKVSNDKYVDSVELMEELYALSNSTLTKFLKNRKGELIQVEVSAPITMEIQDKFAEQPARISLPWAEVGNADDANIILENTDPYWNEIN